jgi:hypothetical protein
LLWGIGAKVGYRWTTIQGFSLELGVSPHFFKNRIQLSVYDEGFDVFVSKKSLNLGYSDLLTIGWVFY